MLNARISRKLDAAPGGQVESIELPLGSEFGSGNTQIFNSGPISIVADARLDDWKPLLAKLNIQRPVTDAEAILESYLRWSVDCVDHLIGDFAFAIADRQHNRVFCARDHIGARPFFYALDDHHIHIGSDIATLLARNPNLAALDPAFAATALVQNNFTPTDRTFLIGVRKLPPGHTLCIEGNRESLSRYWAPKSVERLNLPNDGEYVDAAREILDLAVADRLRDNRRPAVHLSGGLDSSAIAALVTNFQRAAGRPAPDAYAWYFENPDNPADDETRWAEAARAALDLQMHAPQLTVAEIVTSLRADWCCGPDQVNVGNEPNILAHAASNGVSTILSGWGGDESLSFNGRGYRAELLTGMRLRELGALAEGAFPISFARGVKQGLVERFGRAPRNSTKMLLESSYLRPEFAGKVDQIATAPVSLRNTHAAMASLIETGALTARMEDWASAGRQHGIDYSYPLLDRRVMEFAFSLPGHLFYKPGSRRWIMREALDPKLPDMVRYNRSKLEPERIKHLRGLMYNAFVECADLLEDCDDFGERADYVDVQRLIKDLRGPPESITSNFSNKRRALQFLKF